MMVDYMILEELNLFPDAINNEKTFLFINFDNKISEEILNYINIMFVKDFSAAPSLKGNYGKRSMTLKPKSKTYVVGYGFTGKLLHNIWQSEFTGIHFLEPRRERLLYKI